MEDGGGWTVFQKRRHGKVDFNRYMKQGLEVGHEENVGSSNKVKGLFNCNFRDWVDYRDGFGDFKLWNDEFWLGNKHMHSLLSEGHHKQSLKISKLFDL